MTTGRGFPRLIKIEMTGRVRFRQRGLGRISNRPQSNQDDLRFNVRTIKFETMVFVGNADKN
jgi:hypothetical protein